MPVGWCFDLAQDEQHGVQQGEPERASPDGALVERVDGLPIKALVQIEGTPQALATPLDPIEFVRVIAVARITMPKSVVRLTAGREEMSDETQALCFLAGANSIFTGARLLTTPNPGTDADQALFARLGLNPMPAEKTREGHA